MPFNLLLFFLPFSFSLFRFFYSVVKCPSCMRAFLRQRLLLSLLLANVLFPVVFIWWVALYFRTFSRTA